MSAKLKTKKATILAIDDQPANLVALEAVFAKEYNLVTASSGAEAISILLVRKDISVILLDLQMPEMDGFQCTVKIKEIPGYEDVPIIFITAVYKEEPFVRKGYAIGAYDYFSKPFDPEILKMKVGIYATFRQKMDLLRERDRQIHETEELLQASRKLASVLEELPVGVLISDTEGRICQINQVVTKICRADASFHRDAYRDGLGWWDESGRLYDDPDGPLWKALHSGTSSQNCILEIFCLDGTPGRILCSASPLIGLDGQIVGAVAVIHDVTKTKEIEEHLEEKIAKFVELGVSLEHAAH